MAKIHVRVAAQTDVGKVRTRNEDGFVVSDLSGKVRGGESLTGRFEVGEEGVLLAVSDGMGGAQAGDLASALVLHTLERAMALKTGAPSAARVVGAVQDAHRRVFEAARAEGIRMGATLTAVYIHGAQAFIAEVGDSRAYLIRSGRIVRLTHDQSMVQSLIDAGVVAADNPDQPFRNVILQAMGHQENVKVALGQLELRLRDCLVLCSDGLTIYVSDEEIRSVVLGAPSLDAACNSLVALANARGGNDNVTVLAAGVGGELQLPVEPIESTQQVLASFAE
jgi:serine/threonine protein phosphatase PrpC